MSSNSLVFQSSGGISSPATFLFLIFLSSESSSCVNCPSLMSNCLLIILVIGSCVTFGWFPSKFSKCCFHSCIRSSWMVVHLLLITSFTVCHAILDGKSSTESPNLLIWFCMYSVCSFRHMLANSFCAFLSFMALLLVGFLLLHLETVFTSERFVLSDNVSHGTLCLALCLVGMHSAAASQWVLTKFSYSSVGVFDFFCCTSNFLVSVNEIYL